MKYWNYIFCAFLSLVFMSASMPAQAALPGTICTNAIPVTDDFRDTISGQKTVWYSAWTFDLPLTVYFAPQNETDPAPEVEMDFKCPTEVEYGDSILRSLFSPTEGSSGVDMKMPHKPVLQTDHLSDGTFVYYLSLGKKYRDLLLQVGISYNLQVFVKVTYKSAGVISIAPDDMFANCMDGHPFLHLGDSISIAAQDKTTHFIVPYIQWQDDSIRYIWRGEHDVTAAVGYACSYDPESADEVILDKPTLHAPIDTLKLSSADIKYYVNEADNEAGMFYAKFYSVGPGMIKIERVPQAPPKGGATLLKYGHQTQVDTTLLYAIPYTWTSATRFDVPSGYIFRMYLGTTYDFQKQNALATWQFCRNDTGHWLGLLKTEMESLWEQAQEQYLYVRFECGEETTITPTTWTPSECIQNTILIKKNSTFPVNAKSTQIYRIYFRDWEGGEILAYWSQDALCRMLVKDVCEIGTNPNATCYYEGLEDRDTTIIASSDLETCVDKDGYIYMRFYYTSTQSGGQISLLSTAPDETDPEPLSYPKSTIAVVCGEQTASGQKYVIRVSKAQNLTLDGDSWLQTPDSPYMITLAPGVHILQGETESVRIEVE